MALRGDNLVELGRAATRLMKLADPFASPDDAGPLDDWPYPIPLDWRLQLRYLWVDAADAFDVVSHNLVLRASPTSLAQVRFLVESYCLVKWLVSPEDGRDLRALAFARSEGNDLRNVILKWRDHDEERQPTLDDMDRMDQELQRRSAPHTLPKIPAMSNLIQTHYARIAYDVLSEIGSHVGLATILAHFLEPGQRSFDLNMSGGRVTRAYFLGMGFELFALLSIEVTRARGWDQLARSITEHYESTGPLLTEASSTLETQAR